MTMNASTTSFELQPTLQGELIEIRPLAEQDFEALYKVASDPVIWELHPELTRYQRNVFMNFFDSGIKSGGAFQVIANYETPHAIYKINKTK